MRDLPAATRVAIVAALEDPVERRELQALAAVLGGGARDASTWPGPVPWTASVHTAPRLTVAPNPSSEGTTIRLALPTAARVRLAVYDVLGRAVATLADELLTEGAHALRLDGATLPAGVYVVRAELVQEGASHRTLVARITLRR
jgi:hypothetical protein